METGEARRRGMNLRGKFTVGILILGAALLATILTLTYFFYRDANLEKYRQIVAGSALVASELVNGDDVEAYINGREADERFYEMEDKLQSILDFNQLTYLYVYLPVLDEGYCVFIHDMAKAGTLSPEEKALGYTMALDDPEIDASIDIVRRVMETLEPNLELNLSNSSDGYLASAFCPLLNSRGELVAVVGADVDVQRIFDDLNRIMLIMGSSISLLIALAVFGFQMYFARTMIAPLQMLVAHVQNFVSIRDEQGELYPDPIQINTRDEIEGLASAFNQMARDIVRYIEDVTRLTQERQRIEAELSVAAKIQASVLSHDFDIAPNPEDFSLYALMDPAKEVGGDFYDFWTLDDHRLALVVGDVSGKGVPAALFMMMAKAIIRARLTRDSLLSHAFEAANELLCQNNGEDMFVTVSTVALDTGTGEILIADAGHGSPILISADGTAERLATETSLFMGAMEGVTYGVTSARMKPGDRLLLYTDGVNEADNPEGGFFGNDGLLASIQAHGGERDLKAFLTSIREDVRAFAGEAPQADDITMLIVCYKP
ncbi:MAG: SpoIIE family protein phosphatase [Peptococcaceae bacterium]|nr:SpoIIE family protein phosphatase [Peptococcaceae bacterium]